MKQVLQNARGGEIAVVDVPSPQLLPGCVLVRIAASLLSAGTERASSEFASKNLVQKAHARPDLVRDVIGKVRRDGLLATLQTVRTRLGQPTALGYSSAGTVIAVAQDVTDIRVGDRVACAGANVAVHAEIACVPRLLVAAIPQPSAVSFEDAAFTTVGAVALHGIRLAEATLGDTVAVIGLGLLGQLTVQMLKAAGCQVIGMDIASDRAELALRLGANAVATSPSHFHDICAQQTRGHGADCVLITAETHGSEPVNLAGQVARDRAVIVAVGTVGMEIDRRIYYDKELDFRISRSYGPGRYDSAYEQKGRDYPIGHVRWTETRNMEAFLRLLADAKLDVGSLITHRFPVDRAPAAYDLITGKSHEKFLGVIFNYPEDLRATQKPERANANSSAQPLPAAGAVTVGLMGTGAFASAILLPAIRQERDTELVAACSATGVHSRQAAEKFRFGYCTTDESELLRDSNINTLVIATRHNLHAAQVLAAMATGRHIFCEKPLCLKEEELADIVRAHGESGQKSHLLVGFNRRFAPMVQQLKTFVNAIQEPLAMQYRVNAGYIPPDHWLNDPEVGGGRLLGEVCHFIDLLNFVAGSLPVEVETRDLASGERYSGDNVIVSLRFANGSHGSISYFANGDKSFSKERIEVFGGGSVAVLEDFRRLEFVRNGRRQVVRSRLRQDKGHRAEWAAFAHSIRSGQPSPVPFNDIVASTLATLRALESRSSGAAESVDVAAFLDRHGALGAHS
jgi:predicted dehydrogenase/threonine dehydrogenase-like Zn-dependent dehydrogenase